VTLSSHKVAKNSVRASELEKFQFKTSTWKLSGLTSWSQSLRPVTASRVYKHKHNYGVTVRWILCCSCCCDSFDICMNYKTEKWMNKWCACAIFHPRAWTENSLSKCNCQSAPPWEWLHRFWTIGSDRTGFPNFLPITQLPEYYPDTQKFTLLLLLFVADNAQNSVDWRHQCTDMVHWQMAGSTSATQVIKK